MPESINRKQAENIVISLYLAKIFNQIDNFNELVGFVLILARSINKDKFINTFALSFKVAIKTIKANEIMQKKSESICIELAITTAIIHEINKLTGIDDQLEFINILAAIIDRDLFSQNLNINVNAMTDKLMLRVL